MIVQFDRSFSKSLDKLQDKQIIEKLKAVISKMECAPNISGLSGVKHMKGHTGFYRIRIGDYRLGFE